MCLRLLAQGLDGFWRWVLAALHSAAPDLFPAADVLPPSQAGFQDALSLVPPHLEKLLFVDVPLSDCPRMFAADLSQQVGSLIPSVFRILRQRRH